jgi:hypothetical protein
MMFAGLEIAVDDPALVRGGEPETDLPRDLDRLVARRTAQTPEHGGEILAIDVLHDDEDLIVLRGDVVGAADVRVRDAAGDTDFLAKAVELGAARVDAGREEFERDGLVELEVVRAVDLAHAALAQEADDAVARAEASAGSKRPVPGRRVGVGHGRCGRGRADGGGDRRVRRSAAARAEAAAGREVGVARGAASHRRAS